MTYKALIFDTIFDLRDFLNDNDIPPHHIINISLKVAMNGYSHYVLLYLEDETKGESE